MEGDEEIKDRSPDEGRYFHYGERIGKGSFKVVFKAFDGETGAEVAWNQIQLNVDVTVEDFKRMYKEITLLKRVEHPNIIKFHDSWMDEEKGLLVFITELMTSGTLSQFLKRIDGVVKMSRMRNWMRQILLGLDYLHSQEPMILHRDIKSNNIFHTASSEDHNNIKIGDLGLATLFNQGVTEDPKMSVIGTPEYMAPEYYTGTGSLVRDFVMMCLQSKDVRPSAKQLLQHDFVTQEQEGDNVDYLVDVVEEANNNSNNKINNGKKTEIPGEREGDSGGEENKSGEEDDGRHAFGRHATNQMGPFSMDRSGSFSREDGGEEESNIDHVEEDRNFEGEEKKTDSVEERSGSGGESSSDNSPSRRNEGSGAVELTDREGISNINGNEKEKEENIENNGEKDNLMKDAGSENDRESLSSSSSSKNNSGSLDALSLGEEEERINIEEERESPLKEGSVNSPVPFQETGEKASEEREERATEAQTNCAISTNLQRKEGDVLHLVISDASNSVAVAMEADGSQISNCVRTLFPNDAGCQSVLAEQLRNVVESAGREEEMEELLLEQDREIGEGEEEGELKLVDVQGDNLNLLFTRRVESQDQKVDKSVEFPFNVASDHVSADAAKVALEFPGISVEFVEGQLRKIISSHLHMTSYGRRLQLKKPSGLLTGKSATQQESEEKAESRSAKSSPEKTDMIK